MKKAEFKLLMLIKRLRKKNLIQEDIICFEYRNKDYDIKIEKNLFLGARYNGKRIIGNVFDGVKIKEINRTKTSASIDEVEYDTINDDVVNKIFDVVKDKISIRDRLYIRFADVIYKLMVLKMAIGNVRKYKKLRLRTKLILLRNEYKMIYEINNI